MSDTMHFILEIAMFVLACGMILAFIRAVRGPRFTDRIGRQVDLTAAFYGSYCGDYHDWYHDDGDDWDSFRLSGRNLSGGCFSGLFLAELLGGSGDVSRCYPAS